MQEIVVIEDSTIAAMASNVKFTDAIPCLQNQAAALKPVNTGCGACARRQAEGQRQALANIKTCLAGLSDDKKEELKKLLNTKQVKVVFVSATGQVSSVTF
jgi:hypothetical protein